MYVCWAARGSIKGGNAGKIGFLFASFLQKTPSFSPTDVSSPAHLHPDVLQDTV